MRRLELTDEQHAQLVDALTRQHRQTLAPQLAELRRFVDAAPRVVAYVYSVDVPQRAVVPPATLDRTADRAELDARELADAPTEPDGMRWLAAE